MDWIFLLAYADGLRHGPDHLPRQWPHHGWYFQGVPFVSVAIQGTTLGTTSDFEGNYQLVTARSGDSLIVSWGTYPLIRQPQQTIDISLIRFHSFTGG